jgi:catechol 2,3-dioxygenase-like lactoylglutathione lyase family enzyme
MEVVGLTVDLPVRSLDAARHFYDAVMARPPDLNPAGTAEWILRRDPEVALRVVETDVAVLCSGRLGLGVADVDAEHARLRPLLDRVPDVRRKPGVIATLELTDPSGNRIVLWQDLLPRPG